MASSPPPIIRWCPARAAQANSMVYGSAHFFWVHEFGHFIQGSDERATDCWAAQQLAGTCWIAPAVQFFNASPACHPRYGCGPDRAARIQRCAAGQWAPYP
jgi:hypothetical protein